MMNYHDPTNDFELQNMLQETNRINRYLKKHDLCIHDHVKWVSDSKRLGKCEDCGRVKTSEEFKEERKKVYEIIDELAEA
jgi:hypothetical protein